MNFEVELVYSFAMLKDTCLPLASLDLETYMGFLQSTVLTCCIWMSVYVLLLIIAVYGSTLMG